MQHKYKKVRVVRQSERPVTSENLLAFQNEWRIEYDKLEAEYKKDMITLNIKLNELEKELHVKYPCEEEWNWVTSKAEWKKLTHKYGPICVATSVEGPLIYMIMDQM